MSDSTEQIIWKGTPAAAVDFWVNVSCILILPIPWALWRWIQRRNHVMEVTNERIRVTTGILSKRTDELELYRVRDHTFLQPFLLRLFNCGNVVLNTSDTSTPVITLPGVPADEEFRNSLRKAIEACRDRKRARVAELGGLLDVE